MGQISGQHVVVADMQGIIVGDSTLSMLGEPISREWPPPSTPILVDEMQVGSLYIDPVAGPSPADLDFLDAVNRSVLLDALVAGLAAVGVTLLLSSRILQPVERLTEAAQALQKGDLTVQVPVDSQDEIGKLAQAFKAMAGSLSRQEQLRRNMVGDIAHELRTPLTSLRGYLEAARDGLVTLDTTLMDNLYEETMLLQRLVIDLQDLALADAGHLPLVCQPAALAGIVTRALVIFRSQAEAKDVSLQVDVPATLPLVDADPERIGQVLRNLFGNAIVQTPAGGTITVSARPAGHYLSVAVRDTGAGIATEDLPYVFDRFYRADKSRARHTGGAGLGLAIVKQLVLAHGGSITAQSRPGEGSTFVFTLPLAAETTPAGNGQQV